MSQITDRAIGSRYVVARRAFQGSLCIDMSEYAHSLTVKEQAYKLSVITIHRDGLPSDIVTWYRKRCGFCEQQHSAFKSGFGGHHTPSKPLHVHGNRWYVIVIAFNLMNRIKWSVGGGTIKRIRGLTIHHAGDFVRHTSNIMLKTIEVGGKLDHIGSEKIHLPTFI